MQIVLRDIGEVPVMREAGCGSLADTETLGCTRAARI